MIVTEISLWLQIISIEISLWQNLILTEISLSLNHLLTFSVTSNWSSLLKKFVCKDTNISLILPAKDGASLQNQKRFCIETESVLHLTLSVNNVFSQLDIPVIIMFSQRYVSVNIIFRQRKYLSQYHCLSKRVFIVNIHFALKKNVQ